MSADNIKVAVRIRPLVQSELDRGCLDILQKTSNEPQVLVSYGVKNNEIFSFDHVFGATETQEMVYQNAIRSQIVKLFDGYNVTIIAYGQTGSGKTHTMGTSYDGIHTEETGVIPRAVEDIFDKIDELSEYTCNVTCSFMELYQENLYDLLSSNNRESSVVDIREDGSKNIIIPNLTEQIVRTAKETTDCLMTGSAGRAVGATAMNATSSRSHAIFTINIQTMKNGDTNKSVKSKFHLVDLAGSERSNKTKATGTRFKEGVKINQGLLALGNVISALGTNPSSSTHIKYRDSKLTRLLQDSLGGNSITLMIACVSPADYNYDETLSTLRYADRAKQIKNKPVINQDPKMAEINKLNQIIQDLRLRLINEGVDLTKSAQTDDFLSQIKDLENKLKRADKENVEMAKLLEVALHDNVNMENRLYELESTNTELATLVSEIKRDTNELNATDLNPDTCPAEFVVHARAINSIKDSIKHLEDVAGKFNKKITETDADTESDMAEVKRDEFPVDVENVDKKTKAFSDHQRQMLSELNQLKKHLQQKEELERRLNQNVTVMNSFDTGNTQLTDEFKLKDFESIINQLEHEKNDLKEALQRKSKNNSAKIAEERRKRLQQLELEIADVKRKNNKQAQLLKTKEKDNLKLTQLQREIQLMKQKKVELLRTMKSESKDFRQWKLNNEKLLLQLKERNRRCENDMARKEVIFDKQKNVLKRKVEEAVAANKRLKEALDRQQTGKAQRNKRAAMQNSKSDHIPTWLDQEMEVIISVVDVEMSLKQLIDGRAQLTQRAKTLKLNPQQNADEIKQIEEDITMRNAQIADLREKIKSCDVESKIKEISDGMQSISDGRSAIKYLITRLTDKQTEMLKHLDKVRDSRMVQDSLNERIAALEQTVKLQNDQFEEERLRTNQDYQEKVSVLLHQLTKTTENDDEALANFKNMQNEAYDELLQKCEEYLKEIERLKVSLKQRSARYNYRNRIIISDDESDDYSGDIIPTGTSPSNNDPDWQYTPWVKKARTAFKKESRSESTASSIGESFESSVSSSKRQCSCKTKCSTARCGCRKNSTLCTSNCKCKDCENCGQEIKSETIIIEDDKENVSNPDPTEILNGTPTKKIKYSHDNVDITTPIYPYAFKQRKPLLDM